MFPFQKVVISGVGLLGASLGLAIRSKKLANQIIGVGRNEERLQHAVNIGALDSYEMTLKAACRDADFIVLCGPISVILSQIPAAFASAPEGAIITDVGSTKRSIVRKATDTARAGVHFVGSHPMAGSEKSGAEHARANLYEGATVVLTPDLRTQDAALDIVRSFWQALGMTAVEMLPARHDNLVARLSHLPHLVASALVAQTEVNPAGTAEMMRAVAGPGFRDSTRIAMGSVDMWTDILIDNRDAMLTAIDQIEDVLRDLRDSIDKKDRESLGAFLDHASKVRTQYNTTGNPGQGC
ncbi:TPA: prephenate dehydrogenase/arogenate dehydrogenase family protein [Candidatus Sumerlaeota bacterium]|jgi:prephenate dehydrogenase|nr:prephenate dehydrogenase/arogenate dehydrogenase family protein [Candidatus Sumerlaeota bacterium]